MIILRFSDLLEFLKKEYGIEISQKKFSEISGIPSYRLSRIKPKTRNSKVIKKIRRKSLIGKKPVKKKNKLTYKSDYQNVTTNFLNEILEGVVKIILDSGKEIKDIEKEDLFKKLVSILIDYIPDDKGNFYNKILEFEEDTKNLLEKYIEFIDYNVRSDTRKKLLYEHNKKILK